VKKFNTAGPSVAGMHFMIDPLVRIELLNCMMAAGSAVNRALSGAVRHPDKPQTVPARTR
jgi:hypothetical protein